MSDIFQNADIVYNFLKFIGASQEGSIFVILISLCIMLTFKNKMKDSTKLLYLPIISIGIYLIHLWFLNIVVNYFYYIFMPFEVANPDFIIKFIFIIEGMILLIVGFDKKIRKELNEGIHMTSYIIINISFLLLTYSLISIFSSYSVFSYHLIIFSILFLLGAFCLEIFIKLVENKCIPKYKDFKIKLKNILFICFVAGVLFYISFPQTHIIGNSTDYYYLYGSPAAESFDQYKDIYATLYSYENKEFVINNRGVYNYIPVNLENILYKVTEYPLYWTKFIIFNENQTVVVSNLDDINKDHIIRRLGIKKAVYYNNSNTLLLQIDKIGFSSFNISGFTGDNSKELLRNISISRSMITRSNNSYYFNLTINNSLTKPIIVQSMFLAHFEKSNVCNITSAYFYSDVFNGNYSYTNDHYILNTADNRFNIAIYNKYDDDKNNFRIEPMKIPENTKVTVDFYVDC